MGFSKLERAVLEALADELRLELPDLPSQIAQALPGDRRNTGFGFSTGIIVDRNRPPPVSALTGRFGTIHGDVPGVIDPMAFQIDVIGGRLTALHGMTYDEPTEGIEFTTIRLGGLFRIDAQGNSVAWEPGVPTHASPIQTLKTWNEPDAPRPNPTPAAPRVTPAFDVLFGKRDDLGRARPAPPAADLPGDAVLIAGAVAVMAVIALIAVFLFDLPIIAAAILVGYGANLFRRPKAREALRKAVAATRARSRT